jgi:hypothetical protein
MRFEQERALRDLALAVLAARTGLVTLAANAGSTTIVDARLRHDSPIVLQATTASAAVELGNGTLHVSEAGRVNGSVTITHANNAQTDRTFRFFIG